jgi:hypothetical protein
LRRLQAVSHPLSATTLGASRMRSTVSAINCQLLRHAIYVCVQTIYQTGLLHAKPVLSFHMRGR